MSPVQAESVIKNIIREIFQQCILKGKVVSETLVAFMVKAVVLDERNGFNTERTSEKEFAEKLIKICVSRILEKNSPSLDTYQMQVYFDLNYTKLEDFSAELKTALYQRLQVLVQEITDCREKTKDGLEILYMRIVSYIILRSGLGSPTDINVVRETTAALRSVFPQAELGSFMRLLKQDKEKQLVELSLIVTGIRLFNRSCNKGGEGIEDTPTLLNEAFPTAIKNISNEINKVIEKSFLYTDILENASIGQQFPSTLDWSKLKDAHFNTRQHEQFLNILQYDVHTYEEKVKSMLKRFDEIMQSLKETVASKTAVPTAQVYPRFIDLAQLWCEFQDTLAFLRLLLNIVVNLKQFAVTHSEMFSDDILAPYISSSSAKSNEERKKKTSSENNEIINSKIFNEEISILYPESTKNFKLLPIQLKGFCPWALHTYGLLIPSNPFNGVLCYKGMYYAFSKPDAAYAFSTEPDVFIEGISELAKKSPELILLLDLQKQFTSISSYGQVSDSDFRYAPIIKCDVNTQTELHPIESNLVSSYEWNEWELRRKALKLANIRQKITHSVQTDLSHFRRENASQVYLPKNTDTQTKSESGTNVPNPSIFISGLRGCQSKRTDMLKVDLTVDVEQS